MFAVLASAETGTEAPPDVAPEDLVDELEALFIKRDRDEARLMDLLAEAGASRSFTRDGYSSMTALLKQRMSLHPGEAQRLVTRANGLTRAPLTAQSYREGSLSGAQVDLLLAALFAAPDAFPEAEAELVALALSTPLVRDLRKQLDYWLDRLATDELASQRDLVRELRSLTLRREGDMVRLNGWMDIESGERLIAQLDPGPPAEEDTRSAPARRADMLIDILNGSSQRPDIIVHVSAETFGKSGADLSETAHGTFLTADEIRRISCDANLTRVVFGPESQPLDVGRTKRLVTPALRAAITARDMGCVFPGCDKPANWCDAHHLHHWSEGGETKLDNLVLLCRHHHVLVHQAGWQIEGTPGALTFLRPDGTVLGEARPNRPYRSPFFTIPEPPPPTHAEFVEKMWEMQRLLHGP